MWYIKSKSLSRVWLFVTVDCPWGSPGQNTGVGSRSLLQGIFPTQRLNPGLLLGRQILYHWATLKPHMICESVSQVAQSCPTLCDPMDCSLPGSSVHGIFQARILEWVAISFSRGSSWPRDRTRVPHIVGRRFTVGGLTYSSHHWSTLPHPANEPSLSLIFKAVEKQKRKTDGLTGNIYKSRDNSTHS